MTKIAERYTQALHTSNLKSEPHTRMSASDVLGAAGMAAHRHEDAMLLWGVVYGGSTANKWRLVETLAEHLDGYMRAKRLTGNARDIAMEVLAWYLHAKCNSCNGVGYQLIPHTVARSDDPCPDCKGTGKPPRPRSEAFESLLKYVERLISDAGQHTMKKIARNMDF